MQVAFGVLVAAAVLLAIPALVLGAECLLALLPLRRNRVGLDLPRPRLAVIVPAHNEQQAIADTVRAILPQLQADDRLVVVADNCSDQTAALAKEAGAVVWERQDESQRGKGFAVRFALARLSEQPPDVVAIVDADCIPGEGCLESIARLAMHAGRPVQAAYYCRAGDAQIGLSSVSAFAVVVKNYVRPRGLQRIGLPCVLTGTGMAFPWRLLEEVPFHGSHIVEDMQLAVDMAIRGKPAMPCMETAVYSSLPTRMEGFVSQRTRWEHGHLAIIRSEAPRLLKAFARTLRPSLLALLLEIAVPPLSLFLLLFALAGGAMVAVSAALGFALPVAIVALSGFWAALGLTAAWLRFGRQTLPARDLLRIPGYVLVKLPIYFRFLTGRQREWVRTQRDETAAPNGSGPGPTTPS
jgi:cellulose synthase/poly-beta-1,6-N-acetylglucosamine synthase-like glycosyltransferase